MSVAHRPFDAVLIDLDGTLLNEDSRVSTRNHEVLHALEAQGVVCMLATGRSLVSAKPVMESLELEAPVLVFNGAAIYCPVKKRLLEEQVLADRTRDRALQYAHDEDLMAVVVRADRKLSLKPRTPQEEYGLRHLFELEHGERDDLNLEYAIRVTLFSDRHEDSGVFCSEVEKALSAPVYMTHFPLAHLPAHRESTLQIVDVQPPCLGKAEAFRFLRQRYEIEPERVIAFGDATNDIPMFEVAGRSVAMGDGMPEALEVADVVIGDNDSDALAEYLEEVFGL
ncbi:MAG: hypothetical protein DRQ56_10585 [Gammaproteobacteria bacterium]|nr:MAG: hypothetical protein DRQ56_10585 [Gammaproteobacteria bacterium]